MSNFYIFLYFPIWLLVFFQLIKKASIREWATIMIKGKEKGIRLM